MSALYRMAIHEHRHIKIKPDDQIILSAKTIPGNEGSVSGIINHLLKRLVQKLLIKITQISTFQDTLRKKEQKINA